MAQLAAVAVPMMANASALEGSKSGPTASEPHLMAAAAATDAADRPTTYATSPPRGSARDAPDPSAAAAAAKPSAAAATPSGGGGGGGGSKIARVASGLLRFAGQPWFPWVAGLATAINLFTIVFTAATVVLFLGAVLGRPKRWRSTAIANALGATAGSAVLLLLLRQRGEGLLAEQFPTVLASPAWAKTTAIMQRYGVAGMVLVASLPLILHPVIAFGMLSGASDVSILGIVLGGRCLK